jgi:hypothetical protein
MKPQTSALTRRIRRILSQINGKDIPKDEPLSLDQVESIRMGTTVSTNALLERNGERCALITSKGWGDVLLIGMQGMSEPSIWTGLDAADAQHDQTSSISPYASLRSSTMKLSRSVGRIGFLSVRGVGTAVLMLGRRADHTTAVASFAQGRCSDQ